MIQTHEQRHSLWDIGASTETKATRMGAYLYSQLAQTAKVTMVATLLALVLCIPNEAMAKFIQIIPGQSSSLGSFTVTTLLTLPDGSIWNVVGAHIADGVLSAPSLAWANAGGGALGFYKSTTNELSLSVNGVLREKFGGTLTWYGAYFTFSPTDGSGDYAALTTEGFGILSLKENGMPGEFRAYNMASTTTGAKFVGRKIRVNTTVITTGDDLLDIIAEGYVGATNTYQEAARIKFDSSGTISDSTTGIAADIEFWAAKTGAEPAEVCEVRGLEQHFLHVGTAPTITAGGGTNPSIAGTDEAFTITVGSGGSATTVTVTFANAWAVAPRCMANHQGAILLTRCVATTTTVVIDAATAFTAGGLLDVICRSGTT